MRQLCEHAPGEQGGQTTNLIVMVSSGRARPSPASLLMTDEGLLQLTAGMVHSPQTPLTAASHILTDPPHLCDQSMQRPI